MYNSRTFSQNYQLLFTFKKILFENEFYRAIPKNNPKNKFPIEGYRATTKSFNTKMKNWKLCSM